jgi:hypothetical protein
VTKPGIRRISRAKNDFPAPAKVEQSKGLQLARSAYCSADAKDSDEVMFKTYFPDKKMFLLC